MSKSLVKLVDYSLIPASLLIIGKVIGLYITIRIFNLDWGLETIPNSFFSVRPIFYSADIHLASTYSDLIMIVLIIIGFSIVLLQALVLHNTHISPLMVAKLASLNLLGLIKSTFDVYHKAAIWAVFLWISDALVLVNVLAKKTEPWVLAFGVVASLILTVFLLKDVALEIELTKKSFSESLKSSNGKVLK